MHQMDLPKIGLVRIDRHARAVLHRDAAMRITGNALAGDK